MRLNVNTCCKIFSILIVLCFSCKKSVHEPEEEPVICMEPSIIEIDLNDNKPHSTAVFLNYLPVDSSRIKWTSTNPEIAEVDENGRITAVDVGEAEIVATLVKEGIDFKCEVKVYSNCLYKFRITLKDKGESGFSIDRPGEFLSSKAMDRREKRKIAIDETDLPISPEYIKEIENTGGAIVVKSKWLNTVTVQYYNQSLKDKLQQLSFVEGVELVWQQENKELKCHQKSTENSRPTSFDDSNIAFDTTYYGASWNSIKLNNGQVLHELGYKGKGMDIAIIDAGFIDINTNPSLKNINIKGAKSFIYEDSNPYNTDSHGVWVTSCMATNKPGYYVGSAPEANYWLLRTENLSTEYPVEQDYWVAAAEYADSVGVDVINTSLYYFSSKLPPYVVEREHLDGKTELATRAANMAAAKGIFIACCAGNYPTTLSTPGDSPNVLTVGSVTDSGLISEFTASGITVDGRMIPDVVALGGYAGVIDVDGQVSFRSGTSYACPTLCGLSACLWQAFPELSNHELLDIIRQSADRYNHPELPYACGIPDMAKAFKLAQSR
ncbi:serine protease [Marinilabiliaceae bacterium JC017]|nr:serine protease [Marinilabiliaceae bacterium JC017]